ncbi:MAG: transcriptional regulator [Thermoplasmata archaeon HGW-Thermoplasmata-1]|nr:MAG: transcriptional regulator [Thermoplasmata archaeon HGW-Thermoplasmata-1]
MHRIELINAVSRTLARAGFYVSDVCDLRPVSFDIVARRDNQLFIIKVLTNIDAFSESVAHELKMLSKVLKGAPLLIGSHSGSGPLEDEVVYLRYDVPLMTYGTFHDYVVDGVAPLVYAASGGYYVKLNGAEMRRIRDEMGLSLGEVAEAIGVSRRAIGMYEEGMNAKIDVAARLEEFLLERLEPQASRPARATAFSSLVRGFDPFSAMREIWKEVNTTMQELLDMQDDMFRKLSGMGYELVPTRRSPFSMVMEEKERDDNVLLSGVGGEDRNLAKRARIVANLSSVTEKPAVFFVEKIEKDNIGGTPIIRKRELVRINGPEELMELILERRKRKAEP